MSANSPPSSPDPASRLRVVVSDAGPLISLGRVDLLRVLPVLFSEVQVPDQVLRECSVRPDNADLARIRAALGSRWIVSCGVVPLPAGPLGIGERAAIGRALAIGAGLLADDHDARHYAASLGLRVIGTLGVLVRAKHAGLLEAVAPLVERLRSSGQRLGADAVAQALTAAGEEGH